MTRRRRILAIVLSTLLVAIGLSTWIATRPSEADRRSAARARLLLDGAGGRVEFFTLHPFHAGTKAAVPDLHGWRILSRKAVDGRMADRIRRTLEDPGSYGDRPYRCFNPGLAFRFEGPEPVDFVVCLECNQIACFKGGRRTDLLVIGSSGNARLRRIYEILRAP